MINVLKDRSRSKLFSIFVFVFLFGHGYREDVGLYGEERMNAAYSLLICKRQINLKNLIDQWIG